MRGNGFSLVEVLLALAVISLAAAGLGQGAGTGSSRLERGWTLAAAERFARSTSERLGWDLPLRPGPVETGDALFSARLDALDAPDGQGSAWYRLVVIRRGRDGAPLVIWTVVPGPEART